ncbi:MAG: DNA cytosine methyltransferase, partial [Thomasclavelia spiroformis]
IRITKDIQPKVIFFENVHGIMNMQAGKVLQAIVTEFGEIGYQCKYALVNAADYGVPQARPRFVLIGVRGEDKKITFPKPTHGKKMENNGQMNLFETTLLPYVTVEEALSNLPYIEQGEGLEEIKVKPYWNNEFQHDRIGVRSPGILYNHRATKHSRKVQERYAMIPQGCNNSVLPIEIRTKKQNAYKLDMSQPARTVTCNFRTDLIHPIMNRGLTVREAARLQSFDDDYCFFGNLTRKAKWLTQDDQVGNAVPPLLAYAFAEHIKKNILTQFEKE